MCMYIEMFHMDNSVLNTFAESSVSVVGGKNNPVLIKDCFPKVHLVLFTPVVDEDSAA